VASAVDEIHRANPAAGSYRRLFAAGLTVGRQIMAAMFGAVVFAYLGLSIVLFLLPWVPGGGVLDALTNENVQTEVYRLLVAGLAIIWTIPATAAISAWLVRALPPTAPSE